MRTYNQTNPSFQGRWDAREKELENRGKDLLAFVKAFNAGNDIFMRDLDRTIHEVEKSFTPQQAAKWTELGKLGKEEIDRVVFDDFIRHLHNGLYAELLRSGTREPEAIAETIKAHFIRQFKKAVE